MNVGPRLCICGAVAKYDCTTCTAKVGSMSIVYCDNCKSTADVIHFQLTHDAQLNPLNQPLVILDLSSIICVKGGHYFSFVKCGNEPFSPWVFFDGAELENPKVSYINKYTTNSYLILKVNIKNDESSQHDYCTLLKLLGMY